MPNRIIRDGNIDSARMDALSELAELFYRRLWSVVDDYGRFEYDPLVLLAKTWPRRIHRYTPAQIAEWVAECTKGDRPLLILYEVNGKHYLEVQEFDQRIRKDRKTGQLVPSKFPGREAASAAFFGGADLRGAAPRCAARATTAAAPTHTPPTPPAAQHELFPETSRIVQALHPGADLAPKLAAAAIEIRPEITDSELAEVLIRTHRGKRQQSAGLWLRTVPSMLRQLTPPPARASPPEWSESELRQRIAAIDAHPPEPNEHWLRDMRESLAAQLEALEARKPPGSEVRSIGEKTRRGGAT